MDVRVLMIHGNGGGTGRDHWFPWAAEQLTHMGCPVLAPDFPDPIEAKASVWLPYMEVLGAAEDTIIIGHSSGAVAAMRYAETHQLLGSVLVGACYTDLGWQSEKVSGYYDRPWQWERIRRNQRWIIEFASIDDPFIPIAEARHIHEQLRTEYYEYDDRGHFGSADRPVREFPELIDCIRHKLFVL